ncbi:15177_t:CDS:1, partial [Dentiscutata erythropus]
DFLKRQWSFDSVWADKMAILASKKDIKLSNSQISHRERVISTKIAYKNHLF